jgi:molybdopterin-binding protein
VLADVAAAAETDTEPVELEPLLPQAAAASAAVASAANGPSALRTEITLLLPLDVPEYWQPTEIMESAESSSILRERRLQCGLTQAELATRAGVSRQLVAAVEAGQNAPAVDAALRLATALRATVEQLFSPRRPVAIPALGEPLREGALLRVGRVGDQLVAAELADHATAGAGWAKPDGAFLRGALRLFPGVNPAGLVIAGCDPALGVAEAMLQGLGPRSVLAISTATGTALRALKTGRVHAAVVHGLDGKLPRSPVPVLRLHLARWQVGVAASPKLRKRSLAALLGGATAIAQRDPAAASQQALERGGTAGRACAAGRAAGHRPHRRGADRRDTRLWRGHDRGGGRRVWASVPGARGPHRSGLDRRALARSPGCGLAWRPALELGVHRAVVSLPRIRSRRLGKPELIDEEEANVRLSARNQLKGTVTSVRKGEAIANVAVDVGGQRVVASITVEAAEELGLAEGKEVTVVIKASDVMIATDD